MPAILEEDTKEHIRVMEHYLKDGIISFSLLNSDPDVASNWELANSPNWNFSEFRYRACTPKEIAFYASRVWIGNPKYFGRIGGVQDKS